MTLFPPTIDEQIAEVERELDMRRWLYPLRVSEKKMGQKRADLQLGRMEAALETLKAARKRSIP